MQRGINLIILLVVVLALGACATTSVPPPPHNPHSACSMFTQYPGWKTAAKHVQDRWHVPASVQMAIMHQESSFVGDAKPPRTKLLWVIPWKHVSSAYGYSQALDATWRDYLQNTGQYRAKRDRFDYGADFIGWYATKAHTKLNIPLNDPYRLYLAYHEGLGGYAHRSYTKKPWLMRVATRVKSLANSYHQQLSRCDTAVA